MPGLPTTCERASLAVCAERRETIYHIAESLGVAIGVSSRWLEESHERPIGLPGVCGSAGNPAACPQSVERLGRPRAETGARSVVPVCSALEDIRDSVVPVWSFEGRCRGPGTTLVTYARKTLWSRYIIGLPIKSVYRSRRSIRGPCRSVDARRRRHGRHCPLQRLRRTLSPENAASPQSAPLLFFVRQADCPTRCLSRVQGAATGMNACGPSAGPID